MTIVDAMKKVSEREIKKIRMPELGIVTSVFPHSEDSDKDNYECNVKLKNLNFELRGVQIATQCTGLVSPPRVGDLVLVEFVNGNINMPVVVGRLYNDEDRPPTSKLGELVFIQPYEEKSDLRRIYLEFPGGMNLKISDGEIIITAGDTKVSIKKDGDVEVQSKGNIKIKSEGETSINSKGDLSISGSNVKINSDQKLEINSGTEMKINASTSGEITSSTGMKVETAAEMKIKGLVVNIN